MVQLDDSGKDSGSKSKVQPCVPYRYLLMVLGRWIRAFEFRRPLMSVFNDRWLNVGLNTKIKLSMAIRRELISACCLGCLAFTNTGAEASELVICSDASLGGGGSCVSSGLTELGMQALRASQASVGTEASSRPLGSIAPSEKALTPLFRPWRIGLISLFDNVGEMMVCLTELQVTVVSAVKAENSSVKDAQELLKFLIASPLQQKVSAS